MGRFGEAWRTEMNWFCGEIDYLHSYGL